jgi:DNA-binding NtrC family response regulator
MPNLDCTILIADDDHNIQMDLADLLKPTGAKLLFAATAQETLKKVEEEHPSVVLLDIKFPDCNDLTVLKKIKQSSRSEVLIISSQTADVGMIVDAIKSGANDYIPKPFIPEELYNRIEKAVRMTQLIERQEDLLRQLQEASGVDRLIGKSPAMQQVRESIRRFADADGCVLIRGESGTGKELAARALHVLSRRRANPFIAINCAAIPETLLESILFGHRRGSFTGAIETTKGKFEAVGEGTLFLDEIGDMPSAQQAALLRVLEYRMFTPIGETKERECKARFVFATNRDLKDLVRRGSFREELFYRINVATILLPPLRTRLGDIPDLVEHYSIKLATEMGKPVLQVNSTVLELFQSYDWPGNVRELRNVLESSAMTLDRGTSEITFTDLPADMQAIQHESTTPQRRQDREELIRALQQTRGNYTHTARLLGVHRNTVRARIRLYGIENSPEGDQGESKDDCSP